MLGTLSKAVWSRQDIHRANGSLNFDLKAPQAECHLTLPKKAKSRPLREDLRCPFHEGASCPRALETSDPSRVPLTPCTDRVGKHSAVVLPDCAGNLDDPAAHTELALIFLGIILGTEAMTGEVAGFKMFRSLASTGRCQPQACM